MSKVYRTLLSRNPGLELEPYSAKIYENKIIITGNIKNNVISDIVIIDKNSENKKRIITATDARIIQSKKQEGVISLELNNVFSHTAEQGNEGDYEYAEAERMEYNILIQKIIGAVAIAPTAREMTSYDVWKAINDKNREMDLKKKRQQERINELLFKLAMEMRFAIESVDASGMIPEERELSVKKIYEDIIKEKSVRIDDAGMRTYIIEFHKKFSHPFSCVVFIIFAFPVGLLARKSGRILGFMIGVIMSAFYWGMLFVSYRMGYQADISPFLVIWFPNIVFFILGIILFTTRLKR
jgi:lipopolysaccharide export system permease protein